MERRIKIWNLIIKAMDTITKDSKFKEVGLSQIFSFIKGFSCPMSKLIDTRTITAEEIYLALTENSDCVELFQFESITQKDIFFSLRDTPEKLIQKANNMQHHGIKEILNERNDYLKKTIKSQINENNKNSQNLFSPNLNASCY